MSASESAMSHSSRSHAWGIEKMARTTSARGACEQRAFSGSDSASHEVGRTVRIHPLCRPGRIGGRKGPVLIARGSLREVAAVSGASRAVRDDLGDEPGPDDRQ